MKARQRVRGIELRYLLTMHLFRQGASSVAELVDMLARKGFETDGRTSKAVSDALRWEIGRGRVIRLGRGHYGPGWMPRGTEHRIHARIQALSLEGGRER